MAEPRPGKGPKKEKGILLTLNFCDGVNQYVPLDFLIFEGRDDLVDDRLGKVGLLAFFLLLFIAHPAVKNWLELCSNCDLLLLDEVLWFQSSGFLLWLRCMS